jgi:F-type H+-transporting ATPase subunit a
MMKRFFVVLIGAVLPWLRATGGLAKEEGTITWISLLPFWEKVAVLEHPTNKIFDMGNISPDAIGHALLVSALLVGAGLYIRRKSPPEVIPSGEITLGNVFEAIIEFVLGLLHDNMGRGGRKFVPLIGGLFIFILTSNLLGLLPGFLPPTENININAGCAISVFIFYQAMGLRAHGPSYLKHFTGPIWWLAPFMLVIELIGHMARPFSLSIRLYGNIMGDHKVLEIFSGLVPLGLPVFNLALGSFVSVIQALVFSLLSTIYITLAIEEGEH